MDIICPANCQNSDVALIGVKNFSTSSSICKAAIYVGSITYIGGAILVKRGPDEMYFGGSSSNKIISIAKTYPVKQTTFIVIVKSAKKMIIDDT